jgi:hypothetical protein
LFVIDPAGVVFWSYLSPKEVNPGADGILAALEELKTTEKLKAPGKLKAPVAGAPR